MVKDEIKRRLGRPPSLIGYTTQLMSVLTYSSIPGLPLISSPTLILAGDDDPLVRPFNPTLMSRMIPDATLRLIPGAGHMLLLDTTEIVAPIINEFLNVQS